MKMINLSTKKFLCFLTSGVLATAALLLFCLFWITKNIWAVLCGGLLTAALLAWGGIFLYYFQKKLTLFTDSLCRTLDDMMDSTARPEMDYEAETLLARISHRLERLYNVMQKNRNTIAKENAGMPQCPAGELSTRVEKRTAKNGNTYLRYIFSKVKCRKCPQKEKCRAGRSNAKTRSYSITQASEKNLERLKFEESEYFQERMKIRHRIEEKNGELKEAHGLRKADSRGLFAMHLQMYFTAFTANVKRIVRLEELAME